MFEIWKIKRDIKRTVLKDEKAPDTQFDYYQLGRIIGKGSFGKVNIAIHNLTRKLVAIKSINRNLTNVAEGKKHELENKFKE